MRFKGKNIIVTGGTNGIGLATAQRLASEGATVLVTGRNRERLAQTAAIQGVTAVHNDASSPEASQELAAIASKTFSRQIDGVFLNAGLGAFQPIDAVDAQEIARQFDCNVRGPLLQIGALLPNLANGGSVLFNTSVATELGMQNSAVYAGSKGAVSAAMKALSNELAPRGIRVNSVSPGPIDSGFPAAAGMSPEEIEGFMASILPQVPLGRLGHPDEVAAAAAFLLSDEASYVTGSELKIDGGIS